jgi:hypothetical protein
VRVRNNARLDVTISEASQGGKGGRIAENEKTRPLTLFEGLTFPNQRAR